jgi:hypothetical protein
VTITATPDGIVITDWETNTLPNPNGDYSLYGELQSDASAQAVQIRFKTSQNGLTSAPTATNTANTTNIANTQSSGVSQGTKIALGVTIPVVILAFLAGLLLGFRCRALRRRNRPAHANEESKKPELGGTSVVGRQGLVGEERPAGGPADGAELVGEGRPADRPADGAELVGEGRPADRPAGGAELVGEERPAGVVEAASQSVYEAEGRAIS